MLKPPFTVAPKGGLDVTETACRVLESRANAAGWDLTPAFYSLYPDRSTPGNVIVHPLPVPKPLWKISQDSVPLLLATLLSPGATAMSSPVFRGWFESGAIHTAVTALVSRHEGYGVDYSMTTETDKIQAAKKFSAQGGSFIDHPDAVEVRTVAAVTSRGVCCIMRQRGKEPQRLSSHNGPNLGGNVPDMMQRLLRVLLDIAVSTGAYPEPPR